MEFTSRSVRSLVELHEAELRRFLETWERFLASGAPLPEPRGDAAYESREKLVGHVLGAARGYLRWVGACVGRPVTDVDPEDSVQAIAARAPAFAENVLQGWRRHLAALADAELGPTIHKASWGEPYTVYQMLEHAVVHPMLHRVQLDRILAGRA